MRRRDSLTVLRQRAGLVTQKVFNPAQFFRESAGSYNRPGDLWVILNLMSVDSFAHVQVDPQTAPPHDELSGK